MDFTTGKACREKMVIPEVKVGRQVASQLAKQGRTDSAMQSRIKIKRDKQTALAFCILKNTHKKGIKKMKKTRNNNGWIYPIENGAGRNG